MGRAQLGGSSWSQGEVTGTGGLGDTFERQGETPWLVIGCEGEAGGSLGGGGRAQGGHRTRSQHADRGS